MTSTDPSHDSSHRPHASHTAADAVRRHPAGQALDWPQILTDLIAGQDLGADLAYAVMDAVMNGEVSEVRLAGFLVALHAKGETADELRGLADAMVDHSRGIEVPAPAVDIVGTGGDRLKSVNISTMAALVAAGAGAQVVKHGNRASSSKSGSADCLEALGVHLDMPVETVASCAQEVGITFCFAQTFHPSMKYAAGARKQLGVATAFNVLGPMTNPARVRASAVGVADRSLAPMMAGVFRDRGDRALVFRGTDGMDELTITGTSEIWEVRDGQIHEHVFDPTELDMPRGTVDDLRGDDAEYNAQVARRILAGEPGHIRHTVLLNAAAALVALDEDASAPFAQRFHDAVRRSEESIDSGAAQRVLNRWVEYSRAFSLHTE